MRKELLKKIKEYMWTGKAIILTGPDSNAMNSLFRNDIKSLFNERDRYLYLSDYISSERIIDFLKESITNNAYDIYLLKEISLYDNADVIVNLFKDRPEICLIATSEINLNRHYENTSTLIRGRINNIFVPPFLYEDYLNSSNASSLVEYLKKTTDGFEDSLRDYKYRKQAMMLYKCMNKYIGYPLSLTSIFSDADFGVSINTFVSIVNYMIARGYFYTISKIDLEKNDLMKNMAYFYPTFAKTIVDDDACSNMINKILETSIIAKLINEGNAVYKAAYRSREKQSDNSLFKTFLVMNYKEKYFLKLYFEENEESLENYKKFRGLYRKIAILKDDIIENTDDNGVLYLSIKSFLERKI